VEAVPEQMPETPAAIEDKQLMADHRGFGNQGPESPWPCQSDQGDDHIDQQDNEVEHPGNSINTSKSRGIQANFQFAMGTGNK
jgi:hypothetical protein